MSAVVDDSTQVLSNPDDSFVLQGIKSPIRLNSAEYLTNSQKTISSKNLSASLDASGAKNNLTIDELSQSLDEIKLEVDKLNSSLLENADKSRIYLTEDVHATEADSTNILTTKDDDPELTALIQREDDEAVGHVETAGSEWFKDPKHLTKRVGDYPTLLSLGVSNRSVSPVNRNVGRVGAEIMTKELDGELTALDLTANESTFPIRLTAPHIVGVRSLLPPEYPVRSQSPERAKSRGLGDSLTPRRPRSAISASHTITRDRSPSPRPIWMPVDPHANASSLSPPSWKKRSRGRKRAQSAKTTKNKTAKQQQQSLTRSLCIKPYNPDKYTRPTVKSVPSDVELSFLKSADAIDTRRCLVNNSPYQQELARLRLQRLRVEEEYMLQLKREAELERIRGPKPKWYEMVGPEFHYECNKNTAVHKNADKWEDTINYRDELQQVSREFTANMKGPVPNLA